MNYAYIRPILDEILCVFLSIQSSVQPKCHLNCKLSSSWSFTPICILHIIFKFVLNKLFFPFITADLTCKNPLMKQNCDNKNKDCKDTIFGPQCLEKPQPENDHKTIGTQTCNFAGQELGKIMKLEITPDKTNKCVNKKIIDSLYDTW